MDNPLAVGIVERCAQWFEDLDRSGHGPVHAVEPRRQRAAADERADHVRPAVLLAEVVDRQDVRVLEPRHGPRLALEPLQELRIRRVLRRQELDGDVALKPWVIGPPDDCHPA